MNTAVAIVFVCMVLAVTADFIPIVDQYDVRDAAGQFSLSYRSADGTTFSEQGVLKPNNDGTDHVLVKTGSYSYISPEGQPISVKYTSDELGFRPEGAHLPVASSV